MNTTELKGKLCKLSRKGKLKKKFGKVLMKKTAQNDHLRPSKLTTPSRGAN